MDDATRIAYLSIRELGARYRKGTLSPVEVTRLLLSRIEKLNPQFNAYITVTAELALNQARAAEKELFPSRGKRYRVDRGPLHGVPICFKDNIYTAGVRTTGGSRVLATFVPSEDAPVVKTLREAGAVFLGKTNMHEFAYGTTSNNPHYGPVRNPWNISRIAGGSSGGSAAALAAGLCYGSIGTDTGGSIRIPAALCGVVGFKPGLGRVSAEGVIPLSPTLDFVGPLARSVEDAALLLEPLFHHSKNEPRLLSRKAKGKHRKLRLGICEEFFFDLLAKDVLQTIEAALKILEKSGVTFHDVTLPKIRESEAVGNEIAWPEATRFHEKSGWFPREAALYGEDVRTRLKTGGTVPATTYLRAMEQRLDFIESYHLALQDAEVDALIYPTTPIAAPIIGQENSQIGGEPHPTRALLLRLNRPANLAGVPAISIPCGLTAENLPVGLQFAGALSDESLIFEIANHFAESMPYSLQPPI